jgi:hypothetical protein
MFCVDEMQYPYGHTFIHIVLSEDRVYYAWGKNLKPMNFNPSIAGLWDD